MNNPSRWYPLLMGIIFWGGTWLVMADPGTPALSFDRKEIDTSLGVGYAVALLDLNGDGKKDIIVVDTRRVVWYENPTWKRRVIMENQTRADNVCLAAHDIDGDGQIDLFLGADWRPFDTAKGGTLQWLKRGQTLEEPWTVHAIGEEPTLHRIKVADLEGTGQPRLLVGPLMGRGSSAAHNWMDGQPLRLLAYSIPAHPASDRWNPEIIDASLHVMHNFTPVPRPNGKGMDILTASYEGVHRLSRGDKGWSKTKIGTGNQEKPDQNRGASEIKQGWLGKDRPIIATIEPWHGNQVVVYTPPADGKEDLWERQLIDEKLKWGHAVWFADLDGDGLDELIIGVRDQLSDRAGERCGVRIYKTTDGQGKVWKRQLVDEGGVAVEDLACADLDGDGKIDIVAVGRATHNVRIYRNLGLK